MNSMVSTIKHVEKGSDYPFIRPVFRALDQNMSGFGLLVCSLLNKQVGGFTHSVIFQQPEHLNLKKKEPGFHDYSW